MPHPVFQHLPLWARVAIERLDACSEFRTQRQLDEFLDAYAKTYGTEVDETTRTAARHICQQRFGDTFKERPLPEDIPPGTLRLVRLAREGALSSGDRVATRRLGECEVVRIHTPHSIEVRAVVSGEHYLLSGLSFGADARVISTMDALGPRIQDATPGEGS
ncbi:hypothetical protein BA022_08360 [Diaphorobacter nitroreducens]|uniref:hypothetical protein n=1 Tax=Diaphorobacter nitroreducens TaxID=164759 RepID=UPI000B5A1032|nr:hypothetical protein [Diaphorobacter nitroreducens]ASI70506.1 hypothetical protein BA022_08360 [Diaphorobacter nitroreducens]